MASNTKNLNLYKKDPVADAQDTFNITTMLNENWDKIEESLGNLQDSSILNKRFDTPTQRIENIETEVFAERKGKAILTKGNDVITIEDGYDGVADIVVKGFTLNQSIINGNFVAGTTGWSGSNANIKVSSGNVLQITGTGASEYVNAVQLIAVRSVQGDKIACKFRFRVTNANCLNIYAQLFTPYGVGLGATLVKTNPILNTWYEKTVVVNVGSTADHGKIRVFLTAQYADSATANSKIMEIDGTTGVFAIPITGTFMENWTADQINSYINGYWEGLSGVKNPTVISLGENWFDEPTDITDFTGKSFGVTLDNNFDGSITFNSNSATYARYQKSLPKLKSNTEYTVSVDGYGNDYRRVEIIGGKGITLAEVPVLGHTYLGVARGTSTFTFTSPSDGIVFLKYYVSTTQINKSMTIYRTWVNEGTAKPYTTYDGSKLSTEGIELFGLPNGVSDEFISDKGKNTVHCNTNGCINKVPYDLKPNDLEIYYTSASNVDIVQSKLISRFENMKSGDDNFTTGQIIFSTQLKEVACPDLDNVANIGKYYLDSNRLNFIVAKNAYANIEEARGDLITNKQTQIIYQLAAPVIIEEKDFDKHGISVSGDALIKTKKGYNTFTVSSQNFNPVVDIKYDLNIFTAVDTIKDVLSETRKLVSFLLQVQDQQDALLLEHENRLSLIEGA